MMLVLDTSGSMADAISSTDSTTKLAALQNAVASILTINTSTNTEILFGLTTFPAPSGSNVCLAGTISVSIGGGDTLISSTVNSLTASNGTPTGPTLQYLNNSTNCPQLFDSTRQNYILLATDGVPTCPSAGGQTPSSAQLTAINAIPYTNTDPNAYASYPDFELTLQQVISLRSNNINTFVIGVGQDVNNTSPNFLSRLAIEGGMPQSGDPAYYPADSAAALLAAFNQIGQSVLSCKITTALDPGTNTTLDVDLLWLVYNNGTKDVAIPRDPANGFEYIGNNTFEVYGTYCTMLKTGQISKIEIVMACNPAY
jgi:hypothetical protein